MAPAVLLALALGAGCAHSDFRGVINNGQLMIMGMAVNPRPVPPPMPQDYINAANLAFNAGVRGTVASDTWADLEPAPGTYAVQNLQNEIGFFGGAGFKLFVGIQMINTVAKTTPADLENVAWDDPQMKARFHALLDALRPSLASRVKYLSIGNEVDVYLAAHSNEWGPFHNFYEDALAYVHRTMPGMQVGVTATFGGASGASSANVAQLNTQSDAWILTYYPGSGDFQFTNPQAPLADFPRMVSLAGSRPVLLQEVGYASSALLGSSENDQAAFVGNVFQAWQAAGERIPFLSYFVMHDFTPDVCTALANYYGLPNDPNFQAYLCTLGLRHTDGTPKAGWQTFVTTAAADGFPH
jgi:hypothetical protein